MTLGFTAGESADSFTGYVREGPPEGQVPSDFIWVTLAAGRPYPAHFRTSIRQR